MVGLPSLVWSGDFALYLMRCANALLCALMVGFTFAAVSQLARYRYASLATFVALTPMVLFLGGSVNPNALEATAATSLFATLTLIVTRESSRRQLLAGLAVVTLSTLMLTGTRSISLLWVLLALGCALLLGKSEVIGRIARMPIVWLAAAVCVVICGAELFWFLRPSGTVPMPPTAGVGSSPIVEFFRMLISTFDYVGGWIGLFGWVDTPAPAITIGAWTLALGAIIIPSYFVTRGRARWAVIVLGAALILTPAISQAAVVSTSGYIWQGRYTLALLAMLLVACGICLDRMKIRSYQSPGAGTGLERGVLLTVLIGMAIGQLAAFVTALRRYVISAGQGLEAMVTHPQWQPPLGWATLTVLFVLVIAGSTVLIAHAVLPMRTGRASVNGSRNSSNQHD
jgi:hypothetical protein